MMTYVCGFLFCQTTDEVLLIEKQKPDWQKGKLNGIGGKVEEEEFPHGAMVREFREETGLTVSDWTPFVILNGSGWRVIFFHADIGPNRFYKAETQEEEELVICDFYNLPRSVHWNLRWLIFLALDPDIEESIHITDTSNPQAKPTSNSI